MADRLRTNATQMYVALAVLVVTLVLTYTTEYFSLFHGAWLAILGWFLLAAAVVLALTVKNKDAVGMIVPRHIAFWLGIIVMASAIGLVIWANNMFSWPLG